jgi:hypothetical protein
MADTGLRINDVLEKHQPSMLSVLPFINYGQSYRNDVNMLNTCTSRGCVMFKIDEATFLYW